MTGQDIIKGAKTILLPFKPYDLDKFSRIHMGDKKNLMGKMCLKEYTKEQADYYITDLVRKGQIFIWTVYTNEEEPMFAGFIYLTDVSNYMVSIHGIMDKMFTKMSKSRGYAYDSAKTLINYCFEKGVNRIETDVCLSNKKALALDKKLGFVQEGILRKVVIKDNGYDDLVILSILREEWKDKELTDGKRKNPRLSSTKTPQATNR